MKGLNLHWPELAGGGSGGGVTKGGASGGPGNAGCCGGAPVVPGLGGGALGVALGCFGLGNAENGSPPSQAKGLAALWPELAPSPGAAASSSIVPVVQPPVVQQDMSPDVQLDDAARKYLEEQGLGGRNDEPDSEGVPWASDTIDEAVQEAAVVAARQRAAVAMAQEPVPVTHEPKGMLTHVCQKVCRRPISKQDVVYMTMMASPGKWLGKVNLPCIHGIEFGAKLPPSSDRKSAERAAAIEALIALVPHLAPTHDAQKPAAGSDDASAKQMYDNMTQMFNSMQAGLQEQLQQSPGAMPKSEPEKKKEKPTLLTPTLLTPFGGVSGGLSTAAATAALLGKAHMMLPPTLKPVSIPTRPKGTVLLNAMAPTPLDHSPGATSEDVPGQNPKQALNEALGRIVKHPLSKDSTIYEIQAVAGGYQATLSLPCLPGQWQTDLWVSKVCAKKKDAETSAAAAALASILGDPQFFSLLSMPKPNTQLRKGGGGGKGGIRTQQCLLTNAAPKTQLKIVLEGDSPDLEAASWWVDISPATTMQSVRAMIGQSGIPGLPLEYLFCHEGSAISKDQEPVLLARDFLPICNIVNEDIKSSRRKREGSSISKPAAVRQKTGLGPYSAQSGFEGWG